MNKIIGVYKITNAITGDFYIGSSKNIKLRLAVHKCPSTWKQCPNNQLYLDMQKYGIDKFVSEILEEAEETSLKEMEQKFIEKLKPTYNNYNAKGLNIERRKESKKEYYQQNRDKCKDHQKEYQKSDKGKKANKKYNNKYNNQLCSYNGETLTLNALSMRFRRAGVSNPTAEAKKYSMNKDNIKEE